MRKSGQTTRIVDSAIQCLFNNGAVFFPVSTRDRDLRPLDGTRFHPYRTGNINITFSDGDNSREQSHTLEVFLRRLSMEHSLNYKGRRLPVGRVLRLSDFSPKREITFPFQRKMKVKDKFTQQEAILLKRKKKTK